MESSSSSVSHATASNHTTGNSNEHGSPVSEKRARLSCVNCRKRKVKCDRKEPHCAACEKHQEHCVYPLERKRVVRRSAYKDMATRLAKMEKLISDFAHAGDDGSSPSVSDTSNTEPSSKERYRKRSPAIMLPSPVEESDFSWSIPEPEGDRNNSEIQIHPREWLEDKTEDLIYKGPCSIFSQKGIEWVNLLVGDESFGQMVSNFHFVRNARELEFDMVNRHPLPSAEILAACIKTYCSKLNRDLHFFEEDALLEGLESYVSRKASKGIAWYAAINAILAHCYRNEPEMKSILGEGDEDDKYLYNAMSLIPSIILGPADEMCIGAMLSLVLYFMISIENQLAITILGAAIQQMSTAHYRSPHRPQGLSEARFQQRRRLFWHGFILDVDLSLRLRKSPIHGSGQIIELPPEAPMDGIGVVRIGDVSFNFLRGHVGLAKLQCKAYVKLYSDVSTLKTPEQLYADIAELDEELHMWKENIPEPLRPQNHVDQFGDDKLKFLTVLHYTYFQLIIAVHSVVFNGFAAHNPNDRDQRIISSVSLCVGAARASIALLNYHDNSHPFTRYLINHAAWSVDILFMNILQNRSKSRAIKDLKQLGRIVEFYEKYDPQRDNSPSYRVTKTMFIVATRAIQNTQGMGTVPSVDQQLAGLEIKDETNDLQMAHTTPQPYFAPIPNGIPPFAGDFSNVPYLENEWMMPLGFQQEYWQDPWANVFQDMDCQEMEIPEIPLQQNRYTS